MDSNASSTGVTRDAKSDKGIVSRKLVAALVSQQKQTPDGLRSFVPMNCLTASLHYAIVTPPLDPIVHHFTTLIPCALFCALQAIPSCCTRSHRLLRDSLAYFNIRVTQTRGIDRKSCEVGSRLLLCWFLNIPLHTSAALASPPPFNLYTSLLSSSLSHTTSSLIPNLEAFLFCHSSAHFALPCGHSRCFCLQKSPWAKTWSHLSSPGSSFLVALANSQTIPFICAICYRPIPHDPFAKY